MKLFLIIKFLNEKAKFEYSIAINSFDEILKKIEKKKLMIMFKKLIV